MVYNKTTQKLQSPRRRNPSEMWVRTPDAFEPVIQRELFDGAQQLLAVREEERMRKYGEDGMIEKLRLLRDRYGLVTKKLVAADVTMASPDTYCKRFSSFDMAYQRVYAKPRERARDAVIDMLRARASRVDQYDDYIVLDRRVSLLIQPSVPLPFGYREYWAFRSDPRKEVDITLGVPLSNSGQYDILGYLILPRLLVRKGNIRVFSSNEPMLELHGHRGLEMIWGLLD